MYAFALFILVAVTSPVAAASSDLVFCSKLPDRTERIHCYDAAARIAEVGARRAGSVTTSNAAAKGYAPAPMPVAADASALAIDTPAPRRPFHGGYVAIGAGYGYSQTQNIAFADPSSPRGTSLVGAVGYNLQRGNVVFGLEASARLGDEEATFDDVSVQTLPWAPGPGQTYVGASARSSWYRMDTSAHLSARVGMAIDDTMIFAKAGVGATRIESGSSYFANLLICPPCTSEVGFPVAGFNNARGWHPSALLGIGIEQNWRQFFGRVGGEMEAVFPQYSEMMLPQIYPSTIWSVRATGMAGVRF